MTTVTPARPGDRTAVAGPGLPPGRVEVADRVLDNTAQRMAAEVIGVDAKRIGIDITSGRDTAVIRVRAPWPIPALDDTAAVRASTPVREAAAAAQGELRSRLARLFGREISRVDLTISGASAPQRKRVL